MKSERRIDAALAVIVDTGFELNFNQGFRIAAEYLRTHDVPSSVVRRVINYAMHRADAEWLSAAAAFPPRAMCLQAVAGSRHEQPHAGQESTLPTMGVVMNSAMDSLTPQE